MNSYLTPKSIMVLMDDVKERLYRKLDDQGKINVIKPETGFKLYKDGLPINLEDKQLTGVCLADEDPEVYTTNPSNDVSTAHLLSVNNTGYIEVSFKVKDVLMVGENRLKLVQHETIFNSYEDYLKLLFNHFLINVNKDILPKIHTVVKNHPFTLNSIVSKGLSEESRKILFEKGVDVLKDLSLYMCVPEQVRKEVNDILCPFTLQCKEATLGLGDVSILGKIDIFQKAGKDDKVRKPYKREDLVEVVKNGFSGII